MTKHDQLQLHQQVASARKLAPLVLHARVVAGSGGGPDKTILRTAKHTDPHRLRVAAAYLHPHNDPAFSLIRDQARLHGCPLWEIGETGPIDPRSVRHLLQLCKKLRVAVWHGHDYKTNALGLLLSRFWPMKLISTVHGWTWDTPRTRLYYHLDNLCLPRYEQVIAVSPQLYQHCHEHGVRESRLTYIPNAIDPEEYQRQNDTTGARQALNIPLGGPVIGIVSRLSVEKGVDRALTMFAALRRTSPDAQLFIAGEGPQRPQLEKLAADLQIAHAVHFQGWQARPQRFYEALDLLLLPSRTEGMPNVVLEAMAMGTCVAATHVGGVRDLLDNGRCGVILGDDENTWAPAIAPLLSQPQRRAALASLARARIHSEYSFAQRTQCEMAVYERLITLAPAPAIENQSLRRAA